MERRDSFSGRFWLGLTCLFLPAIWGTGVSAAPPSRGAVPLNAGVPDRQSFDPGQSAGFFVGVRRFTKDEALIEVPFAVDDAIDLAHLFALELHLLEPRRVSLALSGEAAKPESRKRLAELEQAGATVASATVADVYKLLDRQSRAAGADGLLVVSFATHGFSDRESQYFMTEDSLLPYIARTAIPASDIFEVVSTSRAIRRLVLLDACRERLQKGRRDVGQDARAAMGRALVEAMAKAEGQAILSAARAGGYAYDDPERQNGVFTASVLDGLRCNAQADDWGYVTADRLAAYVNEQVRAWVREKSRGQRPAAEEGIESSLAGNAASLPLVRCLECAAAAQPDTVQVSEDRVEAYNRDRGLLWVRRVAGTAARGLVADLNGDRSPEVVVGVGNGGQDTGKIVAYGCQGDLFWSSDTSAPFNYGGGHSDRMTVVQITTADLFDSGRRQVLSLSIDSHAFYPSRFCIFDSDGRLLSSYWHPGHLMRITVGSETAGGPKRILLAGLNNDLRSAFPGEGNVAVVLMFDPRNVGGEAPPWAGRSGPGTELWYGFLLPRGLEIVRLEILDRNRDGRNEICVWSNKAHILYIDFESGLISSELGEGATGPAQFGVIEKSPAH